MSKKITNINDDEQGFAFAVILIVLVVLVIGAAYTTVKTRQKAPLNSETTTSAVPAQPLPATLGDVLTPQALAPIVEKEVPGGQVASVELEQEAEETVFKVTLSDGKMLKVNARTGARVGDIAKVTKPESSDSVPLNHTGLITADKAKELALAQMPGKTIRKIQLDHEDGKLVFSVRFTDGSRVNIDAVSGAIVAKAPEKSDDKKTTPVAPVGAGTGSGSTKNNSEGETEHTAPAPAPAPGGSTITQDQARAIGQAKLPTKTFLKVEPTVENGVALFSIRFTDGSRVDIRQNNGEIVRFESK